MMRSWSRAHRFHLIVIWHVELRSVTANRALTTLSIFLRYEPSILERRLVIVGALLRAVGQFHFFSRSFFVRNETQQVRDAIEPRPLLVVGPHDVPWRGLCVRGIE